MEQSEAAAPVVRQLDFSVSYNASTKANALAKGILILPEHPQAQLQSKLLALAQSQHLHARASSSSQPQNKRPPRKVVAVAAHKSPPQELPHMVGLLKSKPIAPRLAHPVKPVKTESPKSRERCNIEPKDSTPKKQKQCNCKNSRCLKLYCECFAAGSYCDNCNCINCHNKIEHEADRKGSIDAILERNPNAFTPKIANSPHGATDGGETCSTSYASCSPLSVHVSKLASSMTLESSKPSYRAPLAGILQLQHVKDFCRLLVEVSAEAAKSLSEEKKMINSGIDVNVTETSVASSHEDGKGDQNEHDSLGLCGNQENGLQILLSESDGSCIRNRRPLSPETLALMCDEEDTVFLSTSTPPTTTQSTLGLNPFYVEQERLVLMRFRSFLNRLITCGCIEGDAHVLIFLNLF
ncbi:UNVERIFIED_CONTAM: Protein tesmin/TSO1-like CXC 6 [Sesamum indicum]